MDEESSSGSHSLIKKAESAIGPVLLLCMEVIAQLYAVGSCV